MRFLADENFPGNSVRLLPQQGCDVVQLTVSEQGSPDEEVIRLATAQARTILPFDRDFGDLIYRHAHPAPPAGVVFFRAKHYAPTEPAQWLLRLLAEGLTFRGYFTTVTPDLSRQRELPG